MSDHFTFGVFRMASTQGRFKWRPLVRRQPRADRSSLPVLAPGITPRSGNE